MHSWPAAWAARCLAAEERCPLRRGWYGFQTRSAMRCVGSPIRTWPWWGPVNTAEPGPVHHALPGP
eukprot:10776725-Alexandrium_andersonii.AAC.1